MNYKKMVAACTGAALAVVSCMAFYSPVEVCAAGEEELKELVDYILALTGNDAQFIRTPAGAFVTGAEIAIYLATENPMHAGQSQISASSISFCSGYYTYNGELCTRDKRARRSAYKLSVITSKGEYIVNKFL